MSNAMLSGLRVIEGSAFVAAPLAGMTLAQQGADIIRFDPIGGGLDYTRWPVAADGTSLYWQGLNKGKRSIAVDIRSPAGRELVTELICAPGDEAGIFLTNFPASGWLDYAVLSNRRADLIMMNITGNADGGSEVDYTVNPSTGLPYLTGAHGAAAPVNHVLPAWDLITGSQAAVAVLAAERRRRLSGEGQYVRLALSDVAFATMGHLGFIAEEQVNGEHRTAIGNELYGAFGSDFVSKDGVRIMIVAITKRMWRAVVEATGLGAQFDQLAQGRNLDLDQEGDRYRLSTELRSLLGAWCGERHVDDIKTAFDGAGVLWSRYQSVSEALADDPRCSTANAMFAEIEQPGIGRYLTPGSPIEFSAAERLAPRRAPLLGEHTEEVLAEVLGLGQIEIGRLHDEGIVASP
jgi:2-methylfumaryl-CoA isomerase